MKHNPLEPGSRFGRLTVLERAPSAGSIRYRCRCDCGTVKSVLASLLTGGGAKSCGCWNHDLPSRRFWMRVEVLETGCWQWRGGLNNDGYGEFSGEGHRLAHRWAFEHFVAPIPEGLQLDHTCRNRACVNPSHLEPVTLRENLLRGKRKNQYVDRTHCLRGHEYTPENTVHQTNANGKPRRRCRECLKGRQQRAAAHLREKRHVLAVSLFIAGEPPTPEPVETAADRKAQALKDRDALWPAD